MNKRMKPLTKGEKDLYEELSKIILSPKYFILNSFEKHRVCFKINAEYYQDI